MITLFKSQKHAFQDPTLQKGPTYHIIHSAKHTSTAFPLTRDLRIMLGLMPRPILLAREAPIGRLLTSRIPTEEGLGMASVMLAQVAAPPENRL